MEPRQITRWEAARFAREAFELGVRVIGGCCGVESHHVRAMAEELAEERERLPAGSDKSDQDLSLLNKKAELRKAQYEREGTGQTLFDNKSVLTHRIVLSLCVRSSKEYWWGLVPSTGRPLSRPFCCQPDPALVNKEKFYFHSLLKSYIFLTHSVLHGMSKSSIEIEVNRIKPSFRASSNNLP